LQAVFPRIVVKIHFLRTQRT